MANTPRDDRFPFLPADDRVIARTRRDPSTVPTIVGYESETSEDPIPVTGDDTSIFARALGRASSDGTTGAVTVADGDPQILLLDQYGRPWVNVAPGSVQNIQGNIANDAPDAGSFPVKIGGRATTNSRTGLPVAVGVDDRVDAAFDTRGRILTVTQGDTDNDDPDDNSHPLKIGGRAVLTPSTGQVPAVAVDDRVNAAFDTNGRQIVVAGGDVTADDPDAGRPVKIGGVAYTTAPAPVSADGDRVGALFDRSGRQQVALPQALAGENLIVNALRTVRAKLQVQQESWLNFRLDNVTGAVVKSGPGRIARLCIINTSATALYVIVHDSTTFTVLGTIIWEGFVPASAGGVPGIYEDDWESSDGLFCPIGISVVTSTGVAAIAGSVQVYGNALYF